MKHIMLDLETLSTKPNAAIISIGAVVMDFDTPYDDQDNLKEVYLQIGLSTYEGTDYNIQPGTVNWWLKQSEEARIAATEGTEDIVTALSTLFEWMTDRDTLTPKEICVWGNGADFDNIILANAFNECGFAELPWAFWNNRCYRTVKNMYKDVLPDARAGTYHNALDDARYQANHLIKIYQAHPFNLS